MVQINFGQREVSCKIVFYGPGMSGKTTNLEVIHQKAPKQAVGEMVSIATETDRTLYFDFMPMDLGQVAGMHTKFMLYTVPGQIYYNATRKLVLQGVDGIIFVADSDPNKMAENIESLQNLRDNLSEMGLALEDMPTVLQFNKRDLPTAMPMADMNAKLNNINAPSFEAVARDGKGVFATLKEVSRLVIERLNREHAPAANRRRTASSLTPPAAGAPTATPPQPVAAAVAPAAAAAARPAPAPAPRPAPPAPSGAQQMTPPAKPAVKPSAPSAAAGGSPGPSRQPGRLSQLAAQGQHNHAPAAPAEDMSARDKHLAKPKPPALGNRQGGRADLGATDPHLKRYQMAQQSGGVGGMIKVLVLVLLAVIIAAIILGVLAFFVPQVRAQLPEFARKWFESEKTAPAAPTTAPAQEAGK